MSGAVALALAATTSPVIAGASLGAYGMPTSTGMIAYQSTLQTAVPARVRGRVFALYDELWNGARLVSLGVGGVLADAIGIRAVYVVGGLCCWQRPQLASPRPRRPASSGRESDTRAQSMGRPTTRLVCLLFRAFGS